ncbi:MAG: hypothetical protein WC966_12335 [Bradymonadales bacterium]
MAYAKVRTDNMVGTILGNALVSFKYQPGTVDTAIENGNVVKIGGYITGQREVRVATTPAVDSDLATIALVASEEVVKSKQYDTVGAFRNEAGDIARGYFLRPGDQFSITAGAFAADSVMTAGSTVELAAGTKLKGVASLTSGSTQVGKIIAVEGEWIVIEVVPAELDLEAYTTTATMNAAIGSAVAAAIPNAAALATIPAPDAGDAGKVIKVTSAEDGFELGVDATGE